MRTIEGKRILITGAAAGIGRALSESLSQQKARLVLVDVDQQGLADVEQTVSPQTSVECHVCDLASSTEITKLVQTVTADEPIDILINNAGVAYYGPTEAMTQDQWDWLMAINLHAPIQLTRELLPSMLSRPEPHVVNMCSISGIVAGGRFAAYHVSKFGLIGFTEALRAEFGRRGMGVSAICPGPVRTDLYKSAASGREGKPVPEPPKLMTASPETIAKRTIRAIRKNKRMTLITPTAHALYQLKRFAPGLIDLANQFSRKKFKRRRQAKQMVQQELQEHRQRRAA
ncbi:MAG: SDR family NAD(P)-dependent oxidoreductase [Planctomycetaceae bacterium]